MDCLTGRRRCRVQAWTGKLVLQVEVVYAAMPPYSRHVESIKHWRDATAQDLLPETVSFVGEAGPTITA